MNQNLKLEIDRAIQGDYDIAIFFKDGEVTVGDYIASYYNKTEEGYLCSIDTSHMDLRSELYGANYTVFDHVQETIDDALKERQN